MKEEALSGFLFSGWSGQSSHWLSISNDRSIPIGLTFVGGAQIFHDSCEIFPRSGGCFLGRQA